MSDKMPTFSPYCYCYNNPLVFVDSSGRMPYKYNWSYVDPITGKKGSYEDKEGNEVDADVVMNYLLNNATIIGVDDKSGEVVKNGGFKKVVDFINGRLSNVSDIHDKVPLVKGKLAKKRMGIAGNIAAIIGFGSSLNNIINGGSPIEEMPSGLGTVVTAMFEMSGINEMGDNVDFVLAQRGYGEMADYAEKNSSIVFIYTEKDIFVDPKNNLYNIPASFKPTGVPFMTKIEAQDSSGKNLNYVYWGFRQKNGSMIIQGKFKL